MGSRTSATPNLYRQKKTRKKPSIKLFSFMLIKQFYFWTEFPEQGSIYRYEISKCQYNIRLFNYFSWYWVGWLIFHESIIIPFDANDDQMKKIFWKSRVKNWTNRKCLPKIKLIFVMIKCLNGIFPSLLPLFFFKIEYIWFFSIHFDILFECFIIFFLLLWKPFQLVGSFCDANRDS